MKHWTPKSGRGASSPQPDPHRQPDPRFEQSFGVLAKPVWENGWSIFPQHREGKREPGTPKGSRKIAYKKTHKLHERLPTAQEIDIWTDPEWGCWSLNVAGVTGDTAGDALGWLTLDKDIYDPVKVEVISGIATEVLGYSPLRRGRDSVAKLSVIYRRPAGALQVARRWVFEAPFEGKEEVVELQDDGLPTTLFGRHHETGEFFIWPDRSPLNAGPDVAPVIDEGKFVEFITRVHSVYPIRDFDKLIGGKAPSLPVDWLDTDVADLRVPAIAEDRETIITGGRRQDWLRPRTGAWAAFNAGIVAPVVNGSRQLSEGGVRMVARAAAREATQFTNYSEGQAYSKAVPLVRDAAAKLVSGTWAARGTQRKLETADGSAVIVSTDRKYPECRDAELSWLPAVKDRATELRGVSLSPSDAELAAARALIADREPIRTRVSRTVRLAIRKWIRRVANWNAESGKPAPRLLIKAPTGAGKTTALVQELGRFKARGGKIGPILMLLPSYENTAELEGREDLGVWTKAQEDRAAEIIREAGAGLSVMTFKGKLAAGCMESDKVKLLMSKRISTAGLCKSRDLKKGDDEDGELAFVYCKYNPENPDFDTALTPCQAIMQKLEVPKHDLVLAAHAFIQTSIPEVLKNVAGIVIDEKIWDKTLGSYTFFLEETLRRQRGEPVMTKEEAAAGFTGLEYLDDRGHLVDIVIPAIRQGRDVSQVVLDHVQQMGRGKTRAGETLLRHTMKVTGRAQRIVLDVRPGMDMVAVESLVKSPDAVDLMEEHKLWSLIQQRLDQLEQDREVSRTYDLHMKLFAETAPKNGVDEREPPKEPVLQVKHDRDHRIIYRAGEGDVVTVVWRKKLNWSAHPTLFLDASGRQEILEKIWGGSIDVVDVKAPLHVRTVLVPDRGYSKTSILPSVDDSNVALRDKAELQTLHREALYTLGLMHGDSAVVACAPKDVRVQINTRWSGPENMHWMHFGAVRGLDFAKHHGAAVSIGSVTPKDTDIDNYVAALSYDDDEPEALNDPHGNGRTSPDPASAKLARRYVSREYPLRDGGTAIVDSIHEYERPWARLLQQQIREEELAQFVGRLRPVYREGEAPVWYVLGKVLPEGTVVDDIATLRDLARPVGRSTRSLRMVKEAGGIITEAGQTMLHLRMPHATGAAMGKLGKAFAANARMRRGFHEISYTIGTFNEDTHAIEGRSEEFRAWVFAGQDVQPVQHFNKMMATLGLKRRAVLKMPIIKTARLSRMARLREFGQPTKTHEIEIVLGDAKARAGEAKNDIDELAKLEIDGTVKFDEAKLGIVLERKTVDPDTYASFRAWKLAFQEAAEADKEREVNLTSLPTDVVDDFDGRFLAALEAADATAPALPVQMFFGRVPAAQAAPAPVPPARNDSVVVPFPRRIGVRSRSTA